MMRCTCRTHAGISTGQRLETRSRMCLVQVFEPVEIHHGGVIETLRADRLAERVR